MNKLKKLLEFQNKIKQKIVSKQKEKERVIEYFADEILVAFEKEDEHYLDVIISVILSMNFGDYLEDIIKKVKEKIGE